MSRKRSLSLSAAALLLAAPLGLTGCGMLGDDSKNSEPATSSQADNGDKSDGGSSESRSPESSAPGESNDQAAGKPSKDEVKNGLKQYYQGQHIPGPAADKLAGCMVDEGYDRFSAKTLNAIKNGKPGEVDPADSQTFTQVSGTCASKSFNGSIPTDLPLPS
ncbi:MULTISPECIES: hypothetical protein [unclassified Yimella]|uniref:hypothetical protein n=1 Tax=unclassified Yimella TaxID=2649892 RepID=UPI00101B9226|nr:MULTISPECIES: hypothetical protein [unclassified Yimella]MCG8654600.1 hypothetical protein [Yimella sp. NH-Cas1]RYG76729.1 hypothetical protein EU513_10690 [Yimella sp. RIT 621]